jgi:hypothetical protein
MSTGLEDDFGGDLQGKPTDTVAAAGVILPALAYDFPNVIDVVLPPAQWTIVARQDVQRTLFVVWRADVPSVVLIRPGGDVGTFGFQMKANEVVFTLRYVDFLTVVTGDLQAFSAAGETVTVATVRRH